MIKHMTLIGQKSTKKLCTSNVITKINKYTLIGGILSFPTSNFCDFCMLLFLFCLLRVRTRFLHMQLKKRAESPMISWPL